VLEGRGLVLLGGGARHFNWHADTGAQRLQQQLLRRAALTSMLATVSAMRSPAFDTENPVMRAGALMATSSPEASVFRITTRSEGLVSLMTPAGRS